MAAIDPPHEWWGYGMEAATQDDMFFFRIRGRFQPLLGNYQQEPMIRWQFQK